MISPPHPRGREGLLFLGVAIAFGLLVWAILPAWPIAMNDDFGYLRSVIETIRHGRPWTDDFLEPWSLSLVAVSAAIFKATGSMYWATIALQTVLSAVSCWLACRIARDRGFGPFASAGIALILLTFPTVIWKQVEYTAMVVYLPCLLAALWCAGRERWAGFFLAWAVAVASRQGAVAWLALPVLAGAAAALREKTIARLRVPALLVIAAAVWFLLLRTFANETHAQRYLTSQLLARLSLPTVWMNLKIGLWVLAVATGCAALLLRLLRPQPGEPRPGTVYRVATAAVALGLLATLPLVANSILLSFEHPFFENVWAVSYLRSLVVAAAVGWLLAPPSFRVAFLGAALAALLLTSLRAELWDYYLVDAALLAFFAVRSRSAGTAAEIPRPVRLRWLGPALGGALVLGIIVLQVRATGPLRQTVDQRTAACSVLEKAMRAGWMQPTELPDVPFGFAGWHLLPHYLAHEGKTSTDLGGFGIYVAKDVVSIMIQDLNRSELRAQRKMKLPLDPAHPFSEIHPRGWFRWARYTLDRPAGSRPADVPLDPNAYRYERFPLNDAEWRELARSASANSSPR